MRQTTYKPTVAVQWDDKLSILINAKANMSIWHSGWQTRQFYAQLFWIASLTSERKTNYIVQYAPAKMCHYYVCNDGEPLSSCTLSWEWKNINRRQEGTRHHASNLSETTLQYHSYSTLQLRSCCCRWHETSAAALISNGRGMIFHSYSCKVSKKWRQKRQRYHKLIERDMVRRKTSKKPLKPILSPHELSVKAFTHWDMNWSTTLLS